MSGSTESAWKQQRVASRNIYRNIYRSWTMDGETVCDVTACWVSLQARQKRQYQVRERRRLAALRAVRAAVREILPQFPSVRRVYAFGSLLRPGRMRSMSDLDLAVEGDLTAEEYFALWRRLEQAVENWPIDLVEPDRDLYFAARVRKSGELIYERANLRAGLSG